MTRWVARLVVGVLPASARYRYGEELQELLAMSARPWADAVDVLALALREHLEVLMRRPLHTVAVAAFVVSVGLFGYVLNDLAGGVADVLRHWWSTGAAGAVVLAGTGTLLSRPHAGEGRATSR